MLIIITICFIIYLIDLGAQEPDGLWSFPGCVFLSPVHVNIYYQNI